MSTPEPLQIAAEITPNPATLKFTVNRTLLPYGSRNFADKEAVKDSPLVASLFELGYVASVMVGTDFVTVTKTHDAEWQDVGPYVVQRLRDFFDSGQEAVAPGSAADDHAPAASGTRSEIEKKIIEILDREIRPAVARDGGDIVFYGYDQGVVKLHLQGACSTCPSSIMTLKMGIENRLKQEIPEIRDVMQV